LFFRAARIGGQAKDRPPGSERTRLGGQAASDLGRKEYQIQFNLEKNLLSPRVRRLELFFAER
jgi:hypothetical protein